MKTCPLCLIAAALLLSAPFAHSQVTAQQALTEAQQDYIRGDIDGAKAQFKLVLQIDPNNVTARNYLKNIEMAENNNGKNGVLEKQLKALVLPRVELKDATFGTALEYLKQTAAKISPDTKVNFVVGVPEDAKTITLSLSNVPFTEVLHYLSELTGYQFNVEAHAIIVKQGAAQAQTSAPPVPDASPAASPGSMQ